MVESMLIARPKQSSSSKAPKKGETTMESEELIRSAFDELEKERARRIELEAELKALRENAVPSSTPNKKSERKSRRRSSTKSSSTPKDDTNNVALPKDYIALQQELEGYRQIVDAMTQEKPAIAAALKVDCEKRTALRTGRSLPPTLDATLPLHVIRLLEVMPWEPKAQSHAFAEEEVFEWQIYNPKQQEWCGSLDQFPSFFQALPIVRSTQNSVQEYQPLNSLNQPGRDRSLIMFLASCENMGKNDGSSASLTAPPDHCVLTTAGLTQIIDISSGFPLPHDGGTWQWIGNWRIEKRAIVFIHGRDSRPQTLDCDENGWSYAFDASDFLKSNPEEHCFDCPGTVEDKLSLEKATFLSGNKVVRHLIPLRQVRRRKWTRRRVLVDYPYASEQSKHFLNLLAQNASLTFAANKISDQLVETKMKLTDTQLKTHQNEEDTRLKISQLEQEIKSKEDMIAKLKQKKAENKSSIQPLKTTKTNGDSEETDSKLVEPIHEKAVAEAKKTQADETDDGKTSPKPTTQQSNDLRVLVSQWVSSTQKAKASVNGDVANASDQEIPLSKDSVASTFIPLSRDEESSVEPQKEAVDPSGLNHDEALSGFSRRNSTSSTNSQISFDWKKLGRDTMEKIKLLNPAGKDAQESQGGGRRSRSTSPTESESITESTLDLDGPETATFVA